MRRTNEVKLTNFDDLMISPCPDAREFVYIMNNILLKLTRSGDISRRLSVEFHHIEATKAGAREKKASIVIRWIVKRRN